MANDEISSVSMNQNFSVALHFLAQVLQSLICKCKVIQIWSLVYYCAALEHIASVSQGGLKCFYGSTRSRHHAPISRFIIAENHLHRAERDSKMPRCRFSAVPCPVGTTDHSLQA